MTKNCSAIFKNHHSFEEYFNDRRSSFDSGFEKFASLPYCSLTLFVSFTTAYSLARYALARATIDFASGGMINLGASALGLSTTLAVIHTLTKFCHEHDEYSFVDSSDPEEFNEFPQFMKYALEHGNNTYVALDYCNESDIKITSAPILTAHVCPEMSEWRVHFMLCTTGEQKSDITGEHHDKSEL